MSTGAIVGLVVAVILVALIVWLMWTQVRRRQLRERFGPEYDRALTEGESRREAERDLVEREKRHSQLDIKPLSSTERDHFSQQWANIQQLFVDQPGTALTEADRMVVVVMDKRGYPTESYDQQLADLSVGHASTLDHYRLAHDIKARNDESRVSTEELREAMVHYRSLVEDLLDTDMNGHGDTRRRHA